MPQSPRAPGVRVVAAPGIDLTEWRHDRVYGLYTHIASNKRRSMLLLAGLFLLVYLLVFAGALVAEGLMHAGIARQWAAAQPGSICSRPPVRVAAALWIVIAYIFHQS